MMAEKTDADRIKVQLGEPILVAQTEKEKEPWGVWQFPYITRPTPDMLRVSFSRTVDDATLDSATKMHGPGTCVSADKGQSWQQVEGGYNSRDGITADEDLIYLQGPRAQDIAKSNLPAPAGICDNGYNGVYTIRDPLKMPAALTEYHMTKCAKGSNKWERVVAVVNDPDGGIICYDPPAAGHAVVYGPILVCEQMLKLPDGSLLAIFYGFRLGQDRKPHPKYESWCLKSSDGGHTWNFHAVIARDDKHPLAGFTEPRLTVLRDGSLLAVFRTECNKTGAMYRTRSTDGGKTWSEPKELWPFGVLPQLLTLENGVTVLTFGRPGVHCLFSRDGEGKVWQNPAHFVVESFEGTGIQGEGYGFQKGENPQGRPKQSRTSGYTSILQTGSNSCLIAYDQFDYPNKDGKPRKSILVRSVTVD